MMSTAESNISSVICAAISTLNPSFRFLEDLNNTSFHGYV
jgi:hypothetical protein